MIAKTGAAKLVRLREFDVSELQRRLAEFEGRRIEAERALVELEERVKSELEASGLTPEATRVLPAFLEQADIRKAALRDIIAQLHDEIVKAREDLRVAFSELKKVEIVVANRERREAEALAKVEQAGLDEIGVERARRAAPAPG